MLLNQQGQVQHIPAKFNSKDNPTLFSKLREVHEPKDKYFGTMFQLGERARFQTVGQRDF